MQTTYRELCDQLSELYDKAEAHAIVRLVLEQRFEMTYTDILCDGLQRLSASEASILVGIMRRLCQGEPVQYVLGEAEFCGRRYMVKPGVLIPRPETAEMAMAVSKQLATATNMQTSGELRPMVLDVCTGSGCIAATIALECPEAKVEAWDISPVALQVAKANVQALGAKVDVRCQDALNAPSDNAKWTAIVSNPPYVLDSERKDMSPHVLNHEPSLALFVPDSDPLRFYIAIARYALCALVPSGLLYFEINPLCANEVASMLADMGFADVAIIDDQYGKQRFVSCRANTSCL